MIVGPVPPNLRSCIYAVDAATGEEEREFTEPSTALYSSPAVVDVTVFVASQDGTLYGVDAGVEGSTEASRVMLYRSTERLILLMRNRGVKNLSRTLSTGIGTLGHHDQRKEEFDDTPT